jgi:uncharacterized RDD family membrane protein YckC
VEQGGESEARVLGLDNIPLELPIAGAGSRALSAFLDYLIVGILVAAWGAGCLALATVAKAGWWALAFFVVGFFVIEYGYFAGVEIARQGQTFGKWAIGLRVVMRDGGRPGTSAFLIRNVVRTVDLIVGVPLMASDDLARRLGDRLAGTLVVHVHAPERETVARRTPRGWDAQEAGLLEAFLLRTRDMEAWRAESLAHQLLQCIREDDPEMGGQIDPALPSVEALRRVVEAGEP